MRIFNQFQGVLTIINNFLEDLPFSDPLYHFPKSLQKFKFTFPPIKTDACALITGKSKIQF